jgi:hypothetical protein
MFEIRAAGFDGAVGAVDATHIGRERCSISRLNIDTGPKLKLPSCTYNIQLVTDGAF